MNLFARKSSSPSVLVLGAGVAAVRIYKEVVEQNPQSPSPIIGFVPLDKKDSLIPDSLILQSSKTLVQLAGSMRASEIVIAQDHPNQSCSTQQLLDCKMSGIRLSDMEGFLQRMRGDDDSKWDGLDALWMYFRRIDWR